ncbi:MAG: hypothetical protein PHR28_13905 [candidate division Zixibacteria bacterium]|jgi:hypothetical protein|nr:hypothetical protein [candidate division Zixibacteria bacterium]
MLTHEDLERCEGLVGIAVYRAQNSENDRWRVCNLRDMAQTINAYRHGMASPGVPMRTEAEDRDTLAYVFRRS